MPNFSELDKIKFMDKQIFIFQFFNYFSNLLFFFNFFFLKTTTKIII